MAMKANDEFDSNVEKARGRVKSMDDVDGFEDRNIGTIIGALECGLRRPETGAQFDAFVMLQDVLVSERTHGPSRKH